MARLIRKLWDDDCGAIIATELLFLVTTLVIGTVTGMVALRQAVVSEGVELAQSIMALDQSYSFSGQQIAGCASTAGSSASDSVNTISAKSVAVSGGATVNQVPCD